MIKHPDDKKIEWRAAFEFKSGYDLSIYVGQWHTKSDCPHGKGIRIFSNEIWEGYFHKGNLLGGIKGRIIDASNDFSLTAEWGKDKILREVEQNFNDGTKFTG